MAGRPSARCTASPGSAAAWDDSDTAADAAVPRRRRLIEEHLVDRDPELRHERVERAHRRLHLARLDLRDRARRELEPAGELAQAEPTAAPNRAKPRPEPRRFIQGVRHGALTLHHPDRVRNGIVAMSVDRLHWLLRYG